MLAMANESQKGSLYAEPVAAATGGWVADLDPACMVFNGIHGGSLIATLVRVAELTTHATAVTLSAHLHAPARPGRLAVTANVAAASRSIASVSLTASGARPTNSPPSAPPPTAAATSATSPGNDDDVLIASASILVQTGTDPSPPEVHEASRVLPTDDQANPDNVEPLRLPAGSGPMLELIDIRPVGPTRPLAAGREPRLTAWVRPRTFSDTSTPQALNSYSPALATTLLDALAPAIWATLATPVPIPTVELSAHLTGATPVDDWFLVDQSMAWSNGAICVDSSELFDSRGTLLAQARQLRRILTPRKPRP